MSSVNTANRVAGLSLRQAAVIAGLGYLLNPVSYAEFSLYPKLVIAGNIDRTVQNITNHGGLFIAAILCYLVNFIGDVVIAWSLYVLLVPVNRAVSLLTAWFRLIYTAVALGGLMNLVTAYRLLHTPEYLTLFGASQLKAQVDLLLNAYRYTWAMSLSIFGIHLVLLGCLIFRSSHIPKILGILLAIDGIGWLVSSLQPYLFPNAPLGYVSITYYGELLFMLWLLIRGWKIKEPAES
jgi:Domain of unknown function (DUF4386)